MEINNVDSTPKKIKADHTIKKDESQSPLGTNNEAGNKRKRPMEINNADSTPKKIKADHTIIGGYLSDSTISDPDVYLSDSTISYDHLSDSTILDDISDNFDHDMHKYKSYTYRDFIEFKLTKFKIVDNLLEPSESDCEASYEKLEQAWTTWKKDFRKMLNPDKIKYSHPNPTAFFAHVILHEKLTYKSENGQDVNFTVQDLANTMNPQFKKFGYKFLRQNWRDEEGASWISGKPIEPGDSSEPGDQRRDGQHEWFPVKMIPKILHTVLRHYSKQDQLAWISALDMFRTPTSDVAINFTWNQDVKAVNGNPGKFKTSQVGIWEYHSGGLYTPERQVNKGNGSFHNKINQLIDRYLDPNKSQLCERSNNPAHPIMASILDSLGCLYQQQGESEKGRLLASQSSLIFEGLEAIDPDQITNLCKWATSFHQKLGEFDRAERLLKKAFTLYTRHFGEDDPKTADICQDLANLYLRQGKYKDAEPWVERLYKSQNEMSNGWHASFQTVFSLGNIYTKLRKYEEAKSLYKDAIELAETYKKTSFEFNLGNNTIFNGEGTKYYLDVTSGPSDYLTLTHKSERL